MKPIYSAALILMSFTTLTPAAPLHAAGSPDTEIRLAASRWETDLRAQNFSSLRQHLQTWAAADFSFNTVSGVRAIDKLIEAEKKEAESVQKTQAYFEKEYNVKLHSSIHFSVQSLQVHGETAVEDALLAYRLPATGEKRMPNGSVQGEGGDLGHSEVYHLTWTRTPLGWKMRSVTIRFNPMIGTALFIKPAKGGKEAHRK